MQRASEFVRKVRNERRFIWIIWITRYVGHITLLGSGDDKTCGYEEEDTCHMRRRMIRPADPGCRGAVL